MTLFYTSVEGFARHHHIYRHTKDRRSGEQQQPDFLGTIRSGTTKYFLEEQGVLSGSETLYTDNNNTLTKDTDYTIDYDFGEITLIGGADNTYDDEQLYADYAYNAMELSNTQISDALEVAEDDMASELGYIRFADQSSSEPQYLQFVNETHVGLGSRNRWYNLTHNPVVKLQTTTNGAYTSGGSDITLTDATGFPASGTIYIGGQKVSYDSRSGNTLTLTSPNDVDDIDDGATVRGEVIEVSYEDEGYSPTYEILTPEQAYHIDYDTGQVFLLDDFRIISEIGRRFPKEGVPNRMRATYAHAWHPPGRDAYIPKDVPELVYKMAARNLKQRAVQLAQSNQRTNFSEQDINVTKEKIERMINRYRLDSFETV